MSSLTPAEHTLIGGIAGLTEICVMQPTIAIKNALQQGRSVPTSPPVLYRGLVVNGAATFPITAIQFGINRFLEKLHQTRLDKDPEGFAVIGMAMTAGAVSAFVGCPAELVMIQQQKTGKSLPQQFKDIARLYGVPKVYKGLASTMVRESLYTAGYLGVAPILRKAFQEQEAINSVPGAALVLSGVTAGVLATVTSHPADTIKTRMQGFLDGKANPEYSSMPSTAKHIYATEGFGAFFSGILPRTVRLIGAVFILTGVRNSLVSAVEDYRYEQECLNHNE